MVMKATKLKKGGFGVTFPAGTRVWYLVDIEEAERDEIKWGKDNSGKPVNQGKTGAKEEIFRFKFAHSDPELGNGYARKDVNTRVSANSNLVKLLKQLAPGKVTDEVIGDLEALCAIGNACIGMPFMVSTEPNAEYNNIQTIMPCPVGFPTGSQPAPAPVQQKLPAAVEAPVAFDDDDIPF